MPTCPNCNYEVHPTIGQCPKCGATVNKLGAELEQEVRLLMDQGRKIEAVKLYKDQTGASLMAAKEAVEAIQASAASLLGSGEELEAELLRLLGRGEKLAAVKLYKEKHGASLLDSKHAVESLADRHGLVLPRRGCLSAVVVVVIVLFVVRAILPAWAANTQPQVVANGLILDLNADQGVAVEDEDRVVKWTNQVASFPARDFLKRDEGRKEPGSGRPTRKKSVAAIGGHDTLVFKRQELVNHDEGAFDHLLRGNGYTWFAVIRVYNQVVQLKDVHSFFGNLKNGGMYEGIWGNVTDDNRVWIGSRNGITFGRWDRNNPMVLADSPLKEGQYCVVAGRMGSGTGEVQIELFINEPKVAASKPFPVNTAANSSKLAIGQERDATNHPGRESFDGELARFLMYERPLTNDELERTIGALKETYAVGGDRP